MPFLGHVVGADGISVDLGKTAVIQQWANPDSVREVRSFLGFANWFRIYILAYSQKVAPLTKLTQKNVPFIWTSECQSCFDWLKACLQQPPVLALPDFDQQFEVRTDASSSGVGAVLMQGWRPLAYENAAFALAERNYTVGEQELLVVVSALKKWRSYLEVAIHPVRIVTDHMPLTYLPTKGTLGPMQVRWSEYAYRFHLEWVHTAGKNNVADILTRLPCMTAFVMTRAKAQSQFQVQSQEPAPVAPKSSSAAHAQGRPNQMESASHVQSPPQPEARTPSIEADQDGFLEAVRSAYAEDSWLQQAPHRRHLNQHIGLWWRKGLLYVPDSQSLREQCLSHVHDHPYAGHVGMKRTAELLSRLYW